MGQSTDGQICFGVVFEEEFEFPWDEHRDSHEGWWRELNGFKPSFYPYTDEDEYKDELVNEVEREKAADKYFKEKEEFDEKYPFPFELVNCCSSESPMYILAISNSDTTCSRGYPQKLNFDEFKVTEEEIKALIDFCETHNLEYEEGPDWYLSSYWGC